MLLFCGNDLAQSFEGREIFRNVTLEVAIGEKVALVGANGVGKTSLLRIIAGQQVPAAGRLHFFKPVKTAMLTEELEGKDDATVADYLAATLAQFHSVRALGEVAKRFGFAKADTSLVKTLSGGEKTRLQLAQLWLSEPDLLLLDEPTNHLDSVNLDWLEQFIREFNGTVIVVSHDRYFLDRCVTRVLELQAEGLTPYPGNYSTYARTKQLQYEQELKAYLDQERQAQKLQKAIAKQQEWAGRGHRESRKKARSDGPTMGSKEYFRTKAKKLDRRVKNNLKRLERMRQEQIAKPRREARMAFNFQSGQSGSDCLLTGLEISKSFGSLRLLNKVNFTMNSGEKVGLIGPNGSGKTTLVKIILGQEKSDSGSLWFSPALQPGYLDQELNTLDGTQTVLEAVAGGISDLRLVRNLLASLLFRGDTVFKPCAVLSMGERVRVGLAKLLLADYNLLVLDEPTNYLDLPSRERLEAALQEYSGALLLVSHDRYLLERVCTSIWSIEERDLQVFPGNYREYLENRSRLHGQVLPELKLQLELAKARILGELATVNRQRFPQDYERLEDEYQEVIAKLAEVSQG
ncbi:MAG TPA: ABC-F type ribosomal protection protein [Bacillota bacterium]